MDKKIIKIFKKYTIANTDQLTDDTLFRDLEIQSLIFVSLIVDLENFYEKDLNDDELDYSLYEKVGDLLQLFK